jgi:hypothetical protein
MKWLKVIPVLLLFATGVKAQSTITVVCSEDYYLTDALFSLIVDGATVSASTACTARNTVPGTPSPTPQSIPFNGSWAPGVSHSIRITFLNDAYNGTPATDRNLYIQQLKFNQIFPPPPAIAGQHVAKLGTQGAYLGGSGDNATWTTPVSTGSVPVITAQPANQSVSVGSSATFQVGETGATAFQWTKNGANIVGATAQTYNTPATVQSDNGTTFNVLLTNGNGSVTSNGATLTVNPFMGSADAGLTTITTWNPADSKLSGCGNILTCTTTFTVTSQNTGVMAVVGLTTQVSSVVMNWNYPSPPATGSIPPTQFNIYRGIVSGGPYTKLGTTGNATTYTYTDSTTVHGTTYYYVVTAAAPSSSCVNATNNPVPCESVYSNEASIAFP